MSYWRKTKSNKGRGVTSVSIPIELLMAIGTVALVLLTRLLLSLLR